MSFISRLFGGKKPGEAVPSPGEAIQGLREIEDMLQKKQDHLEKQVEKELQSAKKFGTKNKRAALAALKRKKRYEKQLAQIDGTLTTIEYQRDALENANTNTEVLKIMSLAGKALKGVHQNMNVDDVHELMDDVHEQQEIANEISDAISNPVGIGADVDEDELMEELEALEQEELEKDLLGVGTVADELPSPPSAEPNKPVAARKKQEEDDDLKQLEEWIS